MFLIFSTFVSAQQCRGLTVDSTQLTFLPSSKSHDTKTRPNIKMWPEQI